MDTILFITCRSCTCRSWLWKICFVEVIEKFLYFVKTLIFFKAKVKLAVQQHPAQPVHFVRCCVTHQVVVRQCISLFFENSMKWLPIFFSKLFRFVSDSKSVLKTSKLFRFVSDSKSEPSRLLCLSAVFGWLYKMIAHVIHVFFSKAQSQMF